MKKKTIIKIAIIPIITSIICRALFKFGESLGIEKMKKFYAKRIEELKDEHDKEVRDSIHKKEVENLKKSYEELNEKYKRCLDRESDMVNNALEELNGLLDFPQRPNDYYKKIIEK